MAMPRKVQWYLEETEAAANYKMVTEGMLQHLIVEMLSRGNREAAELAQFQLKLAERLENGILGVLAKLYGELFSDQELDQMVALYKQPVTQKMRESIPIIQLEVMNFLGAMDFEKLVEEIMAESGM
jgi:hypothetical protein